MKCVGYPVWKAGRWHWWLSQTLRRVYARPTLHPVVGTAATEALPPSPWRCHRPHPEVELETINQIITSADSSVLLVIAFWTLRMHFFDTPPYTHIKTCLHQVWAPCPMGSFSLSHYCPTWRKKPISTLIRAAMTGCQAWPESLSLLCFVIPGSWCNDL